MICTYEALNKNKIIEFVKKDTIRNTMLRKNKLDSERQILYVLSHMRDLDLNLYVHHYVCE